ncbi:hypothetical protein [Salimicrobium flavidum]|uniref:Uncharacterized protein n=1 Tax=Salimicrobium flavidum TaxID=570947 RepID=A0A1N7INN2_9BACI|nr:hypothetical protein [Salimicrobium flavidum]SIS38698.1 hypothetical protein SAMN05421687_101651 [Salimicrobium flavidum]
MEDLYSSTLGTLERTFMPYGSEYQRYIDFQSFREMKQVAKGKRPVYIDLDIEEIVEMKTRYIVDVSWYGIFMTVIIPTSSLFSATVEVYGKPPKLLVARLERINGHRQEALVPTSLKEEFTRKKAIGETLSDFATKLFLFLDSYIAHNEATVDETKSTGHAAKDFSPGLFKDWDFPYAETDPELLAEWEALKGRIGKQYERIEVLEIEDQHALETMINKDVPLFIQSFSKLSEENKRMGRDELVETMNDLRMFVEKLERKEEESHYKDFARSKGIISTKYNSSRQDFFSYEDEDLQ